MDKIAIFNQKGGVGKSTISVNIASCLNKLMNKRVLVVDCDAQGNSSSYLTHTPPGDFSFTLADAIEEDLQAHNCLIHVTIPSSKGNIDTKIDVLPNNQKIDDVTIPDITTIKDIISPLENEYDYCIFDCPPQKTQASLNAICACDYVLIPVQLNADSMQGYELVLKLIEELKEARINETVEIIGTVINNYEKVTGVHNYFMEQYNNIFSDNLFKTAIRHSTIVEQARLFCTPVCYFKKNSPLANDYEAVTKELVKRIKERKRKVGK